MNLHVLIDVVELSSLVFYYDLIETESTKDGTFLLALLPDLTKGALLDIFILSSKIHIKPMTNASSLYLKSNTHSNPILIDMRRRVKIQS